MQVAATHTSPRPLSDPMPVLRHSLAALCVAVAASAVHAQETRAARRQSKAGADSSAAARAAIGQLPAPASLGAYTAAQADRGQVLYRKNCSSCHAATAYTGATFAQLWVGRTAYNMVSLIRETMPNDDPGRLTKQQYVDIVAFLFKLNNYPAGARALPTDDAALKRIAIDRR